MVETRRAEQEAAAGFHPEPVVGENPVFIHAAQADAVFEGVKVAVPHHVARPVGAVRTVLRRRGQQGVPGAAAFERVGDDQTVFKQILIGPAGVPVGVASVKAAVAHHVPGGAPLDQRRVAQVAGGDVVHQAVVGDLPAGVGGSADPVVKGVVEFTVEDGAVFGVAGVDRMATAFVDRDIARPAVHGVFKADQRHPEIVLHFKAHILHAAAADHLPALHGRAVDHREIDPQRHVEFHVRAFDAGDFRQIVAVKPPVAGVPGQPLPAFRRRSVDGDDLPGAESVAGLFQRDAAVAPFPVLRQPDRSGIRLCAVEQDCAGGTSGREADPVSPVDHGFGFGGPFSIFIDGDGAEADRPLRQVAGQLRGDQRFVAGVHGAPVAPDLPPVRGEPDFPQPLRAGVNVDMAARFQAGTRHAVEIHAVLSRVVVEENTGSAAPGSPQDDAVARDPHEAAEPVGAFVETDHSAFGGQRGDRPGQRIVTLLPRPAAEITEFQFPAGAFHQAVPHAGAGKVGVDDAIRPHHVGGGQGIALFEFVLRLPRRRLLNGRLEIQLQVVEQEYLRTPAGGADPDAHVPGRFGIRSRLDPEGHPIRRCGVAAVKESVAVDALFVLIVECDAAGSAEPLRETDAAGQDVVPLFRGDVVGEQQVRPAVEFALRIGNDGNFRRLVAGERFFAQFPAHLFPGIREFPGRFESVFKTVPEDGFGDSRPGEENGSGDQQSFQHCNS